MPAMPQGEIHRGTEILVARTPPGPGWPPRRARTETVPLVRHDRSAALGMASRSLGTLLTSLPNALSFDTNSLQKIEPTNDQFRPTVSSPSFTQLSLFYH